MNGFLETCFSLQLVLQVFYNFVQVFWFVFQVFCLLIKQEEASMEALTSLEGEESKKEGMHLWSHEGQAAQAKGFTLGAYQDEEKQP